MFISYRWNYREHVRQLRRHLAAAGFRAWMDVWETGGGKQLSERKTEGIRAANVVICCVSKKYAESKNYKKEV